MLDPGTPIPYDYSRGLAAEYAFELSINCGLGGYLEPLVLLDPIDLTGVDGFVDDLTDWFRASILRCESPDADPNESFSLLPRSPLNQISRGDFRASVALFMEVLARHDGLEDGFDTDQKALIEERLRDFTRTTVVLNTRLLTKPLTTPECNELAGE